MRYSTIYGNSSVQGGANIDVETLHIFGSVIAHPLGGAPNCNTFDVPQTSDGYNYSDDAGPSDNCNLNASTDKVGAGNNPLLGALANNGGPTQTLLPQTGSPLIDAIPTSTCGSGPSAGITTDQRGVTRPQGPACDIGAVEVEVVVPAPIDLTPTFTG